MRVDSAVVGEQRCPAEVVRFHRPISWRAWRPGLPAVLRDQLAQQRQIPRIVHLTVGNQLAVPDAVQVARMAPACVRAEDGHRDVVAAVPDAERVKRLMKIANQVHQELQGDCPVGAIERQVGEPLLVVEDAVHRAIAPGALALGLTGGHLRLLRTITVAVVARRIRRNVEKVPEERLMDAAVVTIGPRGHVRESLMSQQPGDVALRGRRQLIRGNQADEPMSLHAPRRHARGLHTQKERKERKARKANRSHVHFAAGARFSVSSM